MNRLSLLLMLACASRADAQASASSRIALASFSFSRGGGWTASPGLAAAATLPGAVGETASGKYSASVGILAGFQPFARVPVLFGASPDFGAATEETRVLLSGWNLDLLGDSGSLAVSVGGLPASGIERVSNTQIRCAVPPGAPGPTNLLVSGSLAAVRLPGGFLYTPAVTASPAVFPTSLLEVMNQGPPGLAFHTWCSPETTISPVPPYGMLLIGPAPLLLVADDVYPEAPGIRRISFSVPSDPALSGTVLHFQTLCGPASDALPAVLTNRASTLLR